MALGAVCLFLLASALSHWDEVFLDFFGVVTAFLDLALFVFVHKTQIMKHG